jgi:hypothetical protein
MTGYKSKRDAALDEEGMYLVHHTKRKVDDDDDIQVYKRPWVGLTDAEAMQIWEGIIKYAPGEMRVKDFAQAVEAKLKEKNT